MLPNASKLAKSAFVLVFGAAGGDIRMRFRQTDGKKTKKNTMRREQWMIIIVWI